MGIASLWIAAVLAVASGQQLPTLYEYYTSGGVTAGLQTGNQQFTLNGRAITLYSGSIHYYRVVPQYWRDRLRKARAAGLNAIETYVPWNLHEPKMGVFDFGQGGNDLSALLDIRQFIQIAQEEDLFVILRPGPYVCAELEFGGLPSWLLRYPGIQMRTSHQDFLRHVGLFFEQLIPLVADLQFTQGGAIIAVQIENEYGAFGPPDTSRDLVYLDFIRASYQQYGINELLFTCDTPANSSDIGALPGYLQMANFNTDPEVQFELLMQLQPGMPLMAMEYWSGWYDHWFDPVHNEGNTPQNLGRYLDTIFSYNGSVNFYMFHGGSVYGLTNGANVLVDYPYYLPDVSSYDYSAPLSESGDYTEKYDVIKTMIAANNQVQTLIPPQPLETIKRAYPSVQITEYLSFTELINQVPPQLQLDIPSVTSMEMLDINDGSGQSYGLIVYRKSLDLPATAQLQISGQVHDIAMVVVDGVQKTERPSSFLGLNVFGYWIAKDANFTITDVVPGSNTLDVVVENWGRVNFGYPENYDQRKGLYEGPILVDGVELTNFTAIPLELKASWVQGLTGWNPVVPGEEMNGPMMLRAKFNIIGAPTDTFLDMGAWSKGCIFVNGFPLGRYFFHGPQITSYVPAPLLRQGENEIIIFEHYIPATQIDFTDTPNLG